MERCAERKGGARSAQKKKKETGVPRSCGCDNKATGGEEEVKKKRGFLLHIKDQVV